MSEYQYYEFQAIDKPLSERLMLRFKVLFDQKLDTRMEQGLSSLASVMNELKKTR
ncbi:hypothetical protein [Desulfobacter sp.]|uniref:hypothetical protein n=1 Tax=Desulfobacter sp. TaxID=2294 RepID=UPI003D0C1773